MKRIPKYLLIVLLFSLNACAQETKKTENDIPKIIKTESDWKKQLTPEQYYMLREEGTEKPFTGKFLMHKEKGLYSCGACGNELFTDEMKFDSHCGWPSFDKEISGGKIITKEDYNNMIKSIN